MSTAYQIVVCAGIVPDPLQTLESLASPENPGAHGRRLPRWNGRPTFGGELNKMNKHK
jgi:hypothetical protein